MSEHNPFRAFGVVDPAIATKKQVSGTHFLSFDLQHGTGFYSDNPGSYRSRHVPNAWTSATFHDDFVPGSWNISNDSRQIYKKVSRPTAAAVTSATRSRLRIGALLVIERRTLPCDLIFCLSYPQSISRLLD